MTFMKSVKTDRFRDFKPLECVISKNVTLVNQEVSFFMQSRGNV